MIRKLVAAAALFSLTATPVLARPAQSAQKLSLKNAVPAEARASATRGKSKAQGGFLIPAIAVVAVIVGIILITDDSDSN